MQRPVIKYKNLRVTSINGRAASLWTMLFQFLPSFSSPHALLGAAILLIVLVLKRGGARRRSLSYPPGPRALPIIGNLLDMPQSKFSLTWSEYGETYGPLTWLTIPGQKVLVVNSFEAAKELLEKRPLVYIDRPRFTMSTDLLGLSNYMGFSLYNDVWKRQRSLFKHALSAAVVRRDYSSLFEMKARQYIERCAASPDNVFHETNRIIAEAIIKLTYGKLDDGQGRDYIQLSTRLMEIMVPAAQGYVVDLMPALQYLPKWLPGMKFKRDAAVWRKEVDEIENTVFETVRENRLSDDPEVKSSFVSRKTQELVNKHEEGRDVQQQHVDETTLAYTGLQIFSAGLETTETTIGSFIRAMTLFPSVQEKVQAEIDRVIASGRLPTFKDEPELPYFNAVILETLRWNPVVSFGLPHASRQDDVYDGYFIPKGTTIIANAWGFSRNPKYYTNPSTFDPERYLKQPPELDPRKFIFGYGRRICPGRDLAFQNVWILAASLLWAFKLVGVEEKVVSSPEVDLFSFGLISHPTPFKCRLTSRRGDLKDKLASAPA